ncbi:MAG: SpoIVB peptidase S55 domain-containing protein [Firmicutes bacterium]|nr:SpoIVB peptidase S55 domain-containing protein [Bacillota bacterium]
MIKRIRRGAAMLLFLWMLVIPVFAARELVPVGRVVGIEMESDRVCVAAIDDFMGISAKKAGLMPGDELLEMDGRPVRTAEDVKKILQRSDGTVILKVLRGGRVHELKLHPEATARGPQLGIYLRQGISGIGTVTWYDPETGAFGALGHGVNSRQGSLLKMTAGKVYEASVVSVKKGTSGSPGQLIGAMTDGMGILDRNTEKGVFGHLENGFSGQALPVADWKEITTGKAVIRSTVGRNMPRDYSVEILKIYPSGQNSQRNLLLKVTDPALLEKTGGIVQGMSGSPIIQNGKLVGAVTHVLVNDPTTGYGIFIENMLDAAA